MRIDCLERLLSAVLNSLYSFWWDITKDWGLSLFYPHNTLRLEDLSYLPFDPRRSLPQPSDSIRSTSTRKTIQPGLRKTLLLFRSPLPYYCAILINFVLRLTWSIKLSPHLHRVAERELGIFTLEILEILRRWMWVYFRVEWETIKTIASDVHARREGGLPGPPLEMHNLPV